MGKKKDKGSSGFNIGSMFKKQPTDDALASSESSGKAVAANNRKSSPVLHETVFETVAGICRKNKLFVVRRDDEDVYVGIYLKLDDIGGLSAKTKDESKGSMVSQINSGHISVMFNSDLDAQNGLIFIPTETTISHMMEYALLREDRSYALVLIDAHGEGDFELTDVFVNLEFLEKCHAKKISIKTKLGKYLEDVTVDGQQDLSAYGNSGNSGNSAPVSAPEPVYESEPVQMMDDDDDVDAWQPAPEGVADDSDDFSGADMPDGDEPFDSGGDYSVSGGEFDGEDGDGWDGETGDDDEGEDDEEEEINYEQARQAVARRFFNDDLAIELDTAGLDAALSGYTEFRPIVFMDAESWLADIVNPMIATANQELFDLHRQHMSEVQTSYLNALEQAYLTQMSKLSAPDIKAHLLALQQEYDRNKNEALPKLVEERQQAAREDWDKRVKEYGEAARVAAEQSFKTKYQQQFDDAFARIQTDLQSTLDAEFASTRGSFLTGKKAELFQELDIENAKLIQAAVEEYTAKLPSEMELLKHYQAIIEDTISKYREDEMARIRVLDDELRRDNSIATLTTEYNEKIEAISSEFEARITALQSDMNQQSIRHQSDISAKNQELAELREQYKRDRDDWNSRTNELLTQIRQSDEVRERDIKIRTDEMRAERDSYSEKYNQLQASQKHGYTMMIVITVVSVIAALVLGTLLGGLIFGNKSDDKRDSEPPAGYTDVAQPPDAPGFSSDDGSTAPEQPVTTPDGSGDDGSTGQQAPEQPTTNPGDIPDDAWDALQDPPLE